MTKPTPRDPIRTRRAEKSPTTNNKSPTPSKSRSGSSPCKMSPASKEASLESLHDEEAYSSGEDEPDRGLLKSDFSPQLNERTKQRLLKSQDLYEEELLCRSSDTSLETAYDGPSGSHATTFRERKDELHRRKKTVRPPTSPRNAKPDPDTYEDVRPREPAGIMPVIYILFVFLLIMGLSALAYYFNKTEMVQETAKIRNITDIYNDLKSDLKVLHQQLALTRSTWVQVRAQLDSIMTTSPQQPGVILVVVPKGGERTAICFAHVLTESVKHAFKDARTSMYDSKGNTKLSETEAKSQLHEVLSGLGDHHAAVVYNLESLTPRAAIILHGFCDNDNAPHKQALILLTLEVDMQYDDSIKQEELYSIIEDTLRSVWVDPTIPAPLDYKNFPPIISRIATAPVLIKPESKSVLDHLCST